MSSRSFFESRTPTRVPSSFIPIYIVPPCAFANPQIHFRYSSLHVSFHSIFWSSAMIKHLKSSFACCITYLFCGTDVYINGLNFKRKDKKPSVKMLRRQFDDQKRLTLSSIQLSCFASCILSPSWMFPIRKGEEGSWSFMFLITLSLSAFA